MREFVKERAREIQKINEIALKNEIVIFGATYMKRFPFYELVNKCSLENAIYNRSIEDLRLDEALEVLQECVLALHPGKVFLCLGEREYGEEGAAERYREIVARIREALPRTNIFIMMLPNKAAQAFYRELETFCDGKKVVGIRLVEHETVAKSYQAQFKQLACFFRSAHLSLSDAFAVASL